MRDEAEIAMPTDQELRSILGDAHTIAVVGLSSNPRKESHGIAKFLQAKGYRIIPVNPTETEVLGEKAYASLRDVPEKVDVVDVFRRPEHAPEIAREAVEIGAKLLWLQTGIWNEEAYRIATEGGVEVVMGVCIRTTSKRLETEVGRS
jgi:predicted CoA-binding protein